MAIPGLASVFGIFLIRQYALSIPDELLDAARMAQASGVTLALDSSAVPIAAPEGRRGDVLRWGDDYELLVALPGGVEPPVEAWPIGEVVGLRSAALLLDGSAPGRPLGYEHRQP